MILLACLIIILVVLLWFDINLDYDKSIRRLFIHYTWRKKRHCKFIDL